MISRKFPGCGRGETFAALCLLENAINGDGVSDKSKQNLLEFYQWAIGIRSTYFDSGHIDELVSMGNGFVARYLLIGFELCTPEDNIRPVFRQDCEMLAEVAQEFLNNNNE